MSQSLNISLKGLSVHANPLSEVAAGSMTKATNVVVDREGLIETRRGFSRYGDRVTLTTSQTIDSFMIYDDTLLFHYDSKIAYDSDGAGTWAEYTGSYTQPTGVAKIKSVEANKNLYFTTSAGMYKLDSVTGTPVLAGEYKALNGTGVLNSAGSGWLSTDNQVAYRVVWGHRDANENLILGAPSERIIVKNSTGTADTVTLTFSVPTGVTVSSFYQVYRSVISGGIAITPDDEMGLVYEDNPTAGEIVALSISVIDETPEALRGTTLYTSPSQEGILAGNERPPLCKDVTFYKNLVLYANTISKQRFFVDLLGVGGTNGLAVDDTIIIAGVTYTGKASETAAAGQFKVDTAGTPAEDIENTAKSLIRVINSYASNTLVYAYYVSGVDDLPGKMLIEERGIGGSTFYTTSNNGTAFSPTLPASGTTVSSTNDVKVNRIFVSKSRRPEAVPLLSYVEVGNSNKAILRVISLRDSIFVFKEDGIFRITGESIDNFSISEFDGTVILIAPETAVAFNNQIYAYTNQGITSTSDTGTGIQSRMIESELLPISTFSSFADLSFGIAYDSDRKYLMFTQTESTDTYSTQSYVFNYITTAWTKWLMNKTAGIVNTADDKLYLADINGYIYKENKAFDKTDYVDEILDITITGSLGTTLTVNDTTDILEGWSIAQGLNISVVSSVVDATTLIVTDTKDWTVGAAEALKPIVVEIETVPLTNANPGVLKHHREVTIFFKQANFKTLSLGFRSNISPSNEKINISVLSDSSWGGFPWGSIAWGGTIPDLKVVRTYVPRNKQRAHWITINIQHSTARDYFSVAGMSLIYTGQSERIH